MKVLVVGATGYLGKYVIKVLHSHGHYIRALTRSKERLKDVEHLCDEIFVGEVTQPESVEGCCKDMDVVISSLGLRQIGREPTVWNVDWAGNMAIVVHAWKEHVKHFIFISVLGGDEKRIRNAVPQIEARERVVDELKLDRNKSGMQYTILRPSAFFNDMAELFFTVRSGSAFTIGNEGAKQKLNPIHGHDLANKICEVMENREKYANTEITVGGPDIFTVDQLHELARKISGAPDNGAWRLHPSIVGLTAKAIEPFNVNLYSVVKMMLLLDGRSNAIGEPTGTHHLEDNWKKLNEGQKIRADGTKDVIIHSQQSLTIEIPITAEDVKAEAMLFWEFRTLLYDIGFEVAFQKQNNDKIVYVKPLTREDSHLKLVSGSVKATKIGKFIIKFDNTYSRYRKKSVRYLIKVIRPNQSQRPEDDSKDALKESKSSIGEASAGKSHFETKLEPQEDDHASSHPSVNNN